MAFKLPMLPPPPTSVLADTATVTVKVTTDADVGGTLVGGCTDVIEGLRGGDLAPRLAALGVAVDLSSGPDPQSFLPGWIQPRT